VVLWNDPRGYDAYRLEPRFGDGDREPRANYGSFRRQLPDQLRARVQDRGWTLEELQEVVHLFVLHYDVAGTSRHCFEILHDQRNLSVHFLLDLDGTIYQTLDLKERAWHATIANDHSVGIEIAHPGAYPAADHPAFTTWYGEDESGPRMLFPPGIGDPGLRDPDYVPRPARPEQVRGSIHGRDYWQYDFTEEQYTALAKLTATLSRVFPRIRLQVPRDGDGRVRNEDLSPDALHAFEGLVGHLHVQANKQDPGPALRWDLLLDRSRELLWPTPAMHSGRRRP
jgi:N-acetyl-anhydromuramyl-L-alanine amidase AmpD